MTVVKAIIIMALQLALYYMCGCIAESVFKIKGKGFKTLLMGFFVYYIIFEVIYLPVMLIGGRLTVMLVLWIMAILAIIAVYIMKFRESGKTTAKIIYKDIQNNGIVLGIAAAVAVVAVYILGIVSKSMGNTGYSVGAIVDAVKTGRMFSTESYSGMKTVYRDMPAALSGFYMNFAVYSVIFGVPAGDMTNIVMSAIGVVMSAVAVYCVGKRVLEADSKAGVGFLIIYFCMSLFLISDNSAGGYLIGRAYDEKSFGANVVVPALIYAMMGLWRGKDKENAIKRMLIVIVGSIAVSISSVYAVAAVIIVNFIAFFIVGRDLKYIRSAVVCVIPALIYVAIYTILYVAGGGISTKSGFFNALSGYQGDNKAIVIIALLSFAAIMADADRKNRIRIAVIAAVSLIFIYNGAVSRIVTSLVGVDTYYVLMCAAPVTCMASYEFYKVFSSGGRLKWGEYAGIAIVLVCMVISGALKFPQVNGGTAAENEFSFEQSEKERMTIVCDTNLYDYFRNQGTAVAYSVVHTDEEDTAINRLVNEGTQEKVELIRDAFTKRNVKYAILKSDYNMDVYMSSLLYIPYEQTEVYTVYVRRDDADTAEAPVFYYDGWNTIGEFDYWYEDGVRQGYRPDDIYYQGMEMYDPETDGWYFLDNSNGGAKAVDTDVFFTYGGGTFPDRVDGDGRWVRYGADGKMVYGWDTNENGTYYFNPKNGEMAKGNVEIDGVKYYFDTYSGILMQDGNTE